MMVAMSNHPISVTRNNRTFTLPLPYAPTPETTAVVYMVILLLAEAAFR